MSQISPQSQSNQLANLNASPDDLVVVPVGMVVPKDAPFHVYEMKFLHQPSIIKSGYGMTNLDSFKNFGETFRKLLGLGSGEKRESLRDIVFDKEETGGKLRDSEMPSAGLGLNPDNDVLDQDVLDWAYFERGLTIPAREEVVRPLDVAKTDLPKFWRYKRPQQIVKKMDGDFTNGFSPKGGVGFYIELDAANKTFAFSYALCHNDENFDYELARQITKGRFEDEVWYEVSNYDENLGVVANIEVALYNYLYNNTSRQITTPQFSSTPEADKVSVDELKQLYKRIKTK